MAKGVKAVSLDVDVIEWLSGRKTSALINELCRAEMAREAEKENKRVQPEIVIPARVMSDDERFEYEAAQAFSALYPLNIELRAELFDATPDPFNIGKTNIFRQVISMAADRAKTRGVPLETLVAEAKERLDDKTKNDAKKSKTEEIE